VSSSLFGLKNTFPPELNQSPPQLFLSLKTPPPTQLLHCLLSYSSLRTVTPFLLAQSRFFYVLFNLPKTFCSRYPGADTRHVERYSFPFFYPCVFPLLPAIADSFGLSMQSMPIIRRGPLFFPPRVEGLSIPCGRSRWLFSVSHPLRVW